jgi:trehalose 6-phosphate synthase/phosphatase
MRAIDMFFERHPQWIGKIVFAQISGKTRPGLHAFDEYWQECRQLHHRLTQRWSTDGWEPLLWIEKSYGSAELATIYNSASLMLVNAVRDGLNLTAKEYVGCQSNVNPGVLALSNGTGAWHELGTHCVTLKPSDPLHIADGIATALSMEQYERVWRMTVLKERVRANTLSRWWYTFSSLIERRTAAAHIKSDFGLLKETS